MAKSYSMANLIEKYDMLKDAVIDEDVYYIASRLDKPSIMEIADCDKHLIEALNKSIEKVAHMKQIAELDELLKSLYSRNKPPKPLHEPHTEGNYVYGVCEP
eukprot:TRINITY_DN2609_c0_g2_i1.p2 TRINITY_DN2609_c0_g2~~TRINITY_DN2609_c0_g2_i1.p2  ORF type:complete len:102 (+),score=24.44 TRINITY_DN2609_c0_g2_i1:512-817(+)